MSFFSQKALQHVFGMIIEKTVSLLKKNCDESEVFYANIYDP